MKKLFSIILLVILSQFLINCTSQKQDEQVYSPPEWSKNVIWYQIFVERFNNGDPSNDPKPENIKTASDFYPIPDDWSVTPWTHNWYEQEKWAKELSNDFYGTLQLRRFGGDLQGVLNKLDYLEELGITAIYLNPINDAPSLHKYDVRNYRHVDVNFGPDPIGDNKIIAAENPVDPATWKWTSADKLFLELVEEVHKRGMKIILDYSWNHTGVEFWAWKDIIQNQESSPYKDWYEIISFDDKTTETNEFDYKGWLNIKSLPELKKINADSTRTHGLPYNGDINEGAKQHIFNITQRWLAPDGDLTKGIDGYRLDVADQIPMDFWYDYYHYVKDINPDAYLVGEIWWEQWPDKLMNPVPYVSGNVFDAIMFYQVYRPARSFFAKTDSPLDAKQFVEELQFQWNRIAAPNLYSMMNVAATHDAPRLLTSFNNPGKYKYHAKPADDSTYITAKPGEETYERVKLYLIHQFTSIGSPQIWNGDEMGMWGADDPDCRKPLCWKEFQFEPEIRSNLLKNRTAYDTLEFNVEHFDFYKKIIQLRKENQVLMHGEIKFLKAEGMCLSYERYDEKDKILVMFNLENDERDFEMPVNENYLNLMDETEVSGESIKLLPLTAVILKRINK